MDPNTLNLDPDPEFRPNWDPYQGYVIEFERKFNNSLTFKRKTIFLYKKFFYCNKILSPEEIFSHLSLSFIYLSGFGSIRYSEYGSTKVLNIDPIWIRIHNIAKK